MPRSLPRQRVPDLGEPVGPDVETLPTMGKTAGNTAPGRPFAKGKDARRGVGKKGRSGRRPDWLKALMAEGRSDGVELIVKQLRAGKLTADQMLRIVREWAPPEDAGEGWTVVMKDGEVRLLRNETIVEAESDE